jgi:hypothetical protein
MWAVVAAIIISVFGDGILAIRLLLPRPRTKEELLSRIDIMFPKVTRRL